MCKAEVRGEYSFCGGEAFQSLDTVMEKVLTRPWGMLAQVAEQSLKMPGRIQEEIEDQEGDFFCRICCGF